MKMIHRTFEKPDVSWRRKMSARTVNRIQIQTTNAKKMSIVQKTSRNG